MTAAEWRSIVESWDEQLKALPLATVQDIRTTLEMTLAALSSLLTGNRAGCQEHSPYLQPDSRKLALDFSPQISRSHQDREGSLGI